MGVTPEQLRAIVDAAPRMKRKANDADGGKDGAEESEKHGPGSKTAPGSDRKRELRYMDLARMAENPAPPFPWIAHRILPANADVLLSAHGGTRKSRLMLQLCVALAIGGEFLGEKLKPGRCLYVCCEDDEDEVHRRLEEICVGYGSKIADLHATGNFLILDGSGDEDFAIFRRGRSEMGSGVTALYPLVEDACNKHKPVLLVADGIGDLFDGDEIRPSDAKRFMRLLRNLVRPQKGTAVAIGHVSRAFADGRATGEAFRGGAGWHNAPRCRIEWLHPSEVTESGETRRVRSPEGRMIWRMAKLSGAPDQHEVPVIFDPVIRLFVKDEGASGKVPVSSAAMDRAILTAMADCHAAHPEILVEAYRPATKLKVRPGFPTSISVKGIKERLHALEAVGMVAEAAIPHGGKRLRAWRLTPAGWLEASRTPPETWEMAPEPLPRGRPKYAANGGKINLRTPL
jgi:hypothetical protein